MKAREYLKVSIVETSTNRPADIDFTVFNDVEEMFNTKDEVVEYLNERYNTILNLKKLQKIYKDTPEGERVEVGFIRSYWNKDWSHNSKSWWQQDWIEILKVTESVCDLNKEIIL